MGEVIEKAFPEIGVTLGEQRIGEVAYANDLILLAESPEQLQKKLDGLQEGIHTAGMSLNIKKSATLTIMRDGRRKHHCTT